MLFLCWRCLTGGIVWLLVLFGSLCHLVVGVGCVLGGWLVYWLPVGVVLFGLFACRFSLAVGVVHVVCLIVFSLVVGVVWSLVLFGCWCCLITVGC